ncbi:HD domain-containing phosphohydrolase [Virgibacillus sp. 179-BFC.A HS]|uniref:HD domain-containing phosphohydrolase n=1 Tax=Tigheibacillus jepli TaxID=3035914 RepID=A0ABU5CDN6_9BACI|nr:HD domain-containing phosphohydrolase [Virgibacillus sp. 179-BFC.A HS]MDY0404111.1 HD domain-containing phosphohydrolase [Virgibacillus sp. 179-BFC.A HS]
MQRRYGENAKHTCPLKSERNQAQEAQYRKHPVYSYRMIENEKGLHHFSKLAVLQHHERIDGSGFPIGLASAKLHRFSKIIAVCDTFYEIMLANPEISAFKAMEDMQKNEFTRLDPVWMKKMQQIFSHLEVGTIVELSDGKKAEIIFNEPNEPLRPIVRVQDSEEIMALQTNPSVYIDSIVPNHP